MPLLSMLLSFVASFAIAGAARHQRALSRNGFLAAALVGGIVTAAGGWEWGLLLLGFFISSSLLSKFADLRRPDDAIGVAGDSERDLFQVVANGAIPAACAIAMLIDDQSRWFILFAASLAVANADTWATEIGSFSRGRPRLITSGRTVPTGTSGAISPLGTAGTVAGAFTLALLAAALAPEGIEFSTRLVLAIAIGGIAGSLIDSLLGATLQLQLYCPTCNEITEEQVHRCGTPSVYLRGMESLTNDTVNMLTIAAGAFIAWVIWAI
jgi:uncharacterized protein (TIGR00297 family)